MGWSQLNVSKTLTKSTLKMYLIFIGALQPLKSCPDNVYQLNTKLSEYCRDRNAAGGDGDRFVKN